MSFPPLQTRLEGLKHLVIMSEDDVRNQAFMNALTEDGGKEKAVCGKLKEPRDLYSTASLQHAPKWPIECQVIPEKIRHKETIFSKPEPFHVPNSAENQPKPVGEEMGTVIFHYQPRLSVDYFCRACVGGSEDLQFFETDANSLKFESRFESGNLAKAIKITNVYYELYLRPDMYTDRHSQWFYFRIQNTKDNIVYRFSIVNLSKPDSLYRYGLKPLMYSEKEAQLNNIGWIRCGQNISYYKNDLTSDDCNSLYTLTFTLKFRFSNDTVYIAQCYPYTYTRLQNYLAEIEANENKSEFCQQRLLCRSLAGNNVYVLTITSPENYSQENTKKPVILLSARVHPGETQSSYMMKGIIDFLTSNFRQAKELRDRFIFKLIPMLNPDGVIVGNSRCCLLGQDLNRQYRTVLREAFPQIYHTKVMMRRLMEENGIYLYCDLHGHSRRNNVFMYGCENKRVPEKRLIEQVFPLMMQKNAADKFSFQNCKFKIQRSKEGTGRVFAWTLGVHLSYTIEISLGGSTQPARQHTHFNTYDYEAAGRHFCETLLDYSDTGPEKGRLRERILQKLQEGGSTAEEPHNVPISDYSSLSHSETEESSDGDEKRSCSNKQLKRKNSVRRQNSVPSRPHRKPKEKPGGSRLLKIERSVLSISKASVATVVEIDRNSTTKVRKVEECTMSQSVVQTRTDAEFEDSLARLNKFKRRSKRVSFRMPTGDRVSNSVNFIATKCASILFDDPFKPPSAEGPPTKSGGNDENGSRSLSEDECDDADGAFKNQRYFPTAASVDIADEFALLQLSSSVKNSKRPEQLSAASTVAPTPECPVAVPWRPKAMFQTLTPDLSVCLKSERRRIGLERQKTILDKVRPKTVKVTEPERSKQTTEKVPLRLAAGKDEVHKQRSAIQISQRRRVSWTAATTSTSSSSFVHAGHTCQRSQESIVANAVGRKESTSRRALRKCKSLGDKIEELPSQPTDLHYASKKRKKRLKRSKNKK